MGVAIKKAGKCHSCKGKACTIGKKNDLCILGTTKQCWSKKYECRLPANNSGAGGFLGQCLPKVGHRHHHHHRHMLAGGV